MGLLLPCAFAGSRDPHPTGAGPRASLTLGHPPQVAELVHLAVFGQTAVTLGSRHLWWCSPGIAGSVGFVGSHVLSFTQVQQDPSMPNNLRLHPLKKLRCKEPYDLGS